MKISHVSAVLAACLALAAHGSVPIAWTNSPAMPPRMLQPVPHGSTIEFSVTLAGYSAPPIASGADVRMWFQTNGMGGAWWSAPATISGNVIRSTFGPAQDTGADRVSLFFGAPSNVFAAAVLRFSHAPGFAPNVLEIPRAALDFATVEYSHAPWVETEQDPTVPAWAKAEIPPQTDISGKADKTEVAAAAQAATNYTDLVTDALSQSLSSRLSQASQASTNYTDEAIAGLATAEKIDISRLVDYWTYSEYDEYWQTYHYKELYRQPDGSIEGSFVWAQSIDDGRIIFPIVWFRPHEHRYYFKRSSGDYEFTLQDNNFTGEETTLTFQAIIPELWNASVSITINRTYQTSTNRNPVVYTDALEKKVNDAAQSSTNYTDTVAADLYPKPYGETLATQVAAIGAVLNGEDARFVVTNYDSVVHTPEAYVEINVSNNWLQVWREGNRWEKHETETHTWKTNITTELSHKADRAWGAYDSETGGYAPDGYVQISTSNILVAAGMAYQRTVTSDGAVWVLQCNSGVASIGGDTNGFFRVQDGDGETQFEIVQGDKRTIGADADGISVDNSTTPATVTIHYSVIADAHPTLEITSDLAVPDWKDEQAADCLANVSWSGTSGSYVATVQPWGALPSLFVKASYMAGGETYIRNVAPVSFQGGVLCTDGIHKVRFVYSNGTVNLEVVQ